MKPGYRVLDAASASELHDAQGDFALDVLMSLSEQPKRLSSMYFYDDRGSELFRQITELEEYYPTNCESEILERYAAEIVGCVHGASFNLVDLGAGDGKKTLLLLQHLAELKADVRYVPIDISEGAMVGLVDMVRAEIPEMEVAGLVTEYANGVRWLGVEHADRVNLVLFLGSNIGNFDRAHARAFLRRLWNALRPGDYALIGFDLKKDIEILLHAYNDSQGVTAEFNLNLLARINRELGGNFDLSKWRHFGTYDVFTGAMMSYLVSLSSQRVEVAALSLSFEFDAWEPILTEYSYKYLRSDIEHLAADTGFVIEASYSDSRDYFVDSVWRVDKSAG